MPYSVALRDEWWVRDQNTMVRRCSRVTISR